jgi:hypothetical protein
VSSSNPLLLKQKSKNTFNFVRTIIKMPENFSYPKIRRDENIKDNYFGDEVIIVFAKFCLFLNFLIFYKNNNERLLILIVG